MPRPLPDFVTCGHCGDTWPLTTRPYPLANGICHDCRRHLKKPNYMLAAENQRLKGEVVELVVKLNESRVKCADLEDRLERERAR